LPPQSGGNCALSQAGKVVLENGAKIVGHYNVPSRTAADACALYARNLLNFITPQMDAESKSLNLYCHRF
jgi:proton-translocating NAD(P)+ transhydrogenase subunit alpha